MNDEIREITAHNVERLLRYAEMQRDELLAVKKRLASLEAHVRGQTADIAQAKQQSNAAFAIARNINGSATE